MSVPTRDAHPTALPEEGADLPLITTRRDRPAGTRSRRLAVGASALLALAVATAVGLSTLPPGDGWALQSPAAALQEDGTELVRDGVEKGFLTGLRAEEGAATVVVDRAILLSGEQAVAEAERRGLEAPPNDVLLVDDDPRLREYPVSPDVRVTVTVGLAPADATGEVEISLGELRRLLGGPSVPPSEVLGGYLFDLVVEDGVVVGLRHVYLV